MAIFKCKQCTEEYIQKEIPLKCLCCGYMEFLSVYQSYKTTELNNHLYTTPVYGFSIESLSKHIKPPSSVDAYKSTTRPSKILDPTKYFGTSSYKAKTDTPKKTATAPVPLPYPFSLESWMPAPAPKKPDWSIKNCLRQGKTYIDQAFSEMVNGFVEEPFKSVCIILGLSVLLFGLMYGLKVTNSSGLNKPRVVPPMPSYRSTPVVPNQNPHDLPDRNGMPKIRTISTSI